MYQLHFYCRKLRSIQVLFGCLEAEVQINVFKNFNVREIAKKDNAWVVPGGRNELKADVGEHLCMRVGSL